MTDTRVTATEADREAFERLAQFVERACDPNKSLFYGPKGTAAADIASVRHRLAHQPASADREAWKCFHCGDVFTDAACARLHFGRDEDSAPACQIKAGAEQGLLGALRAAEYEASDARRAIADECTDAARAHYAQASRHDQALRNAEEAGYERGLADGRALASSEREADHLAVVEAVAIWSGEHRAYWRRGVNGQGANYTLNLDEAGIWSRDDAVRLTSHCGPEKAIALHTRPDARAALASTGDAIGGGE